MKWITVAIGALFLLGWTGGASAQAPGGSPSVVLAIDQSNYTTLHDNFTVSLKVANTAGIQFVYFTFCQLSSPLCYLPVSMTLHGTNWFIGSTKPMTSYQGMNVGVKAGYNITIVYSDNKNVTEPTVPNPFGNLSIAQSVTGEYMFAMTVSNPVYGLTGVVRDSATGIGLPGANVTLTPGNLTTTRTSATGAYSFSGLLNGTYSLSVAERGYRTVTETVAIAGRPAVEDVPLSNDTQPVNPNGTVPGGSSNLFAGSTLVLIGLVVVGLAALAGFVLWRRNRRPPAQPPPLSPGPSSEEKV